MQFKSSMLHWRFFNMMFTLQQPDFLYFKSTGKPDLDSRARIFKCLLGPEIDSKEWIPPAYVAWRAGTITQLLLGS